jgi:hypothetical protein
LSNEKYSLVWVYNEARGSHSTKNGYKAVVDQEEVETKWWWRKLWKTTTPTKKKLLIISPHTSQIHMCSSSKKKVEGKPIIWVSFVRIMLM